MATKKQSPTTAKARALIDVTVDGKLIQAGGLINAAADVVAAYVASGQADDSQEAVKAAEPVA